MSTKYLWKAVGNKPVEHLLIERRVAASPARAQRGAVNGHVTAGRQKPRACGDAQHWGAALRERPVMAQTRATGPFQSTREESNT